MTMAGDRLRQLGLSEDVVLGPDEFLGRVAADFGIQFEVWAEAGVRRAIVPGKSREQSPAVGDFVVMVGADEDFWQIRRILPRRTELVRQAAGRKTKPQVIGTNLDTVFVVTSMNQEFNPRRLERYLTTIEKSGARPVILLNKADLADEPAAFVAEAMGVASGVEVVALSAISEVSVVEKLSRWLGVGQTVAFVGSSGVGKSTIINALLGRQTQRVADIREDDDEGRHTTTHRQLFELPGHGLLLDTPGMRELQLWGDEDDIEEAFPDVEEFASGCRFADCKHEREPGCAVMAAVASGELSAGRVDAWKKLRAELALQAQKTDVAAQIRERQKARNTGAAHKRDYKLIRAKKGDV